MENFWYASLLAVHNVVLVILAGGLLSFWLLAQGRYARALGQLEVFDHLAEESMIAHPAGYLRGLVMLGLTGGGMPLVHYLYHGAIKSQTVVSWAAFGIKGVLVVILVFVLMQWQMRVEKPLAQAYQAARHDGKAEAVKTYFDLAAKRNGYLKAGWILAFGVLVVTPFLSFFQL